MLPSFAKIARTSIAFSPLYQRSFSVSAVSLAKKGKKENKKDAKKDNKKNTKNNDDTTEEVVLDPKKIINDLKAKYDNSFSSFSKNLTAIKMGKANPEIFDNLKIKIDDKYTANFKELATIQAKGNFLNVVVFDPNHSKRIISSILEANLNLNPEQDVNNEQILKIKLPTSTKDVKLKQVKEMKELLDQYKTNGSFKSSLVSIRSTFMKDLKNVEGSKDIVKKLSNDIDATYKSYAEKMSTLFKSTEKSLS